MSPIVSLARDPAARYPTRAPFHPSESYPEFRDARWAMPTAQAEPNAVYPLVRQCLRNLGLDAAGFGTPGWNPLGTIVHEGDRVVVKPNFVLHERGVQAGQHCLITHGSVLRALLDYVLLAGGPKCRIVIADAPLQQADFDAVSVDTGLPEIVRHYRDSAGVNVETLDLRRTRVVVDDRRIITSSHTLPGDPRGYSAVRLDAASQLEPITTEATRFAVTDYDRTEMARHHGRGRHEYLISNTVLASDAFINVPKLKTHQKVGVTLALKNLVGINGSKDWLPHYRPGAPAHGGDEYAVRSVLSSAHSGLRARLQGRHPRAMRAAQVAWHAYRRIFESRAAGLPPAERELYGRTAGGAWHGNDTTWRMVLDLNQAIFHALSDGTLGAKTRRRYLAVVDGIVGGEGDGPLSPEPRAAGLIAASLDPVALDRVCAHVMGFDPSRIRLLREATRGMRYSVSTLAELEEPSVAAYPDGGDWREINLRFRPAPGWHGAIERVQTDDVTVSV